ncbi:MAG: gamma-glutamyl-gamma-aminobutyrate hydrolase family protein [Lentisphaeria bacterium]|nr:gamma-glutamyl-gamma-aminobutyrate hydrolase family protein [Lentisphaeria bacterium]
MANEKVHPGKPAVSHFCKVREEKPSENARPVILLNMAADTVNGRECEVLISRYAQRVSDAGAVPMLIPSIEKKENIETLLDLADGVLLIGGRDYDPRFYGEEPRPETVMTRRRPHFDIAFGEAVLARAMPVLGICAGCQLLCIVSGGKLIQHLPDSKEHTGGATHRARVLESGFFAQACGAGPGEELTVNSFHHQAVDPEHPGRNMRITARAFDGSVEGIELAGERMVLGVQFHPERMDDLGPRVFTRLREAAAAFQAERK